MNYCENFAHLWLRVAHRAVADEDCSEITCYYKPSEIDCDECKWSAQEFFNLVVTSTLAGVLNYDEEALERRLKKLYKEKKEREKCLSKKM